MPDRTEEFLPSLLDHRIPGLPAGEGFVYPCYDGRSLLNVPDSLCHLLEAPGLRAGALAPELLEASGLEPGRDRRVVLVLLDALSLNRLRRWIAGGSAPVWKRLVDAGQLVPLTSITPSTTSAAMCTLWTGRSPAEHGIAGYELWMKEYGVVVNTILHTPSSFRGDVGGLERAGFSAESYLPFPTLGTHLARHGIASTALVPLGILNSGLSRMVMHGVRQMGYSTLSDLWVNARRLVEDPFSTGFELAAQGNPPEGKAYIYIYWSALDTFSHRYGPDDERTLAEFEAFSLAFERLFLEKLSPQARRETLLIFTADHGAAVTEPDPYYDLREHPNLLRRLHLLPTGEQRLTYLYIRPGQTEAVREYIERTWRNQFTLFDPLYALEAGLFGPGKPHPALPDRLGDLIAAAKGRAYCWWSSGENRLFGRHGGLSADEMLIPFLTVSPEKL
jgi:hypothetical protein